MKHTLPSTWCGVVISVAVVGAVVLGSAGTALAAATWARRTMAFNVVPTDA